MRHALHSERCWNYLLLRKMTNRSTCVSEPENIVADPRSFRFMLGWLPFVPGRRTDPPDPPANRRHHLLNRSYNRTIDTFAYAKNRI